MKTNKIIFLSMLAVVIIACTASPVPISTATTIPTSTAVPTPIHPTDEVSLQLPQNSSVPIVPTPIFISQPWTNILSLAIDPQNPMTLFAGASFGLYKSTDGATSWTTVTSDVPLFQVTTLAIDPGTTSTLYAGADNNIIKSTDGGVSWSVVNSGITDTIITNLVIDPLNPSCLYIGTNSGVIKSTDGGENWTLLNTGLVITSVNVLAIDPVNPTTLYVGTTGGVYKSMDGGERWSAAKTGLYDESIISLAINPVTPTTLFAGSSGGAFRSTDAGASWDMIRNGLNNTYVASLTINPNSLALYAGTFGGVYTSRDDGGNWIEVNTGLPEAYVYALANDPFDPDTIYAGTEYGVFKSVNAGGSWNFASTGMEIQRVATAPTQIPAIAQPVPPTSIEPSPTPGDWRVVMDTLAVDSVHNVPLAGMTLAIRRPGEPDWVQAYGFADLAGSIPASSDTVYPIGSLSMQFTAVAMMQLVERGQLDLHAPISQYLEGLPPELRSITTYQLLTYTSQINDPVDIQALFFGTQDFTSEMLLQELVPILYINLDFPQRVRYGSYILAGLILEQVSRLSYSDYMTQYVFAPAGLQNTSYCLPVPANLARTYSLPNEVLEPLHLNVSAVFAAGGICSTAGDLLQWMDALTTGKVISVESYQQMITPIMLSDGSIGTVGYGLYTIQDTSYGLQVGFYGMEASFDAYLISYPERGLTIVWLTNTAQPDNRILDGIFTNIPILMP